jgi:hypothetical protein
MIPEKIDTKTILIFDVLTAKRQIRKSMVYTWTLVPSLQKKKMPTIIICRVNNTISKTSAFAAEIFYIMLKIKN